MNKKTYTKPEFTYLELALEDIVTTSDSVFIGGSDIPPEEFDWIYDFDEIKF